MILSSRSVFCALQVFAHNKAAFGFLQGIPTTALSLRSGPICASRKMTSVPCGNTPIDTGADPSVLPGDPSLTLVTNVDLGDNKLDVMKACSKSISEVTGKPEAYVAVSITDNASVIFGGTDAPTALGNLYSLGSISIENNSAIQNTVTDLLEPYGVAADRIYVNFFDMPRANIGWNRKTFAG